MIEIIENGKPYPNGKYRNYEGATIIPYEVGFSILIILGDMTLAEQKLFKRGAFSYGLFVKEGIPFIVLKFQDMTFDMPFNILNIDEDIRREWASDKESNLITFHIVERKTYIVKGQRAVGFEPQFINDFKTACENIVNNSVYSREGIDRMINQINMTHTTLQMIGKAKMYNVKAVVP